MGALANGSSGQWELWPMGTLANGNSGQWELSADELNHAPWSGSLPLDILLCNGLRVRCRRSGGLASCVPPASLREFVTMAPPGAGGSAVD
jgi:hypothetical protein